MKITNDPTKAPESKPASKSEAKDDLKTLPMPEVEKKLGSSPEADATVLGSASVE